MSRSSDARGGAISGTEIDMFAPALPAYHRIPERQDAQYRVGSTRLKIWEIRAASRCSVIGTCLTLGELRKIAKRTRFIEDLHGVGDYDLHGMIVARMQDENPLSRTLQKYLDEKFEGAIRKARSLDRDEQFFAYWEVAVDTGLVPGAYWALVTHPALSLEAEVRIYGEIHMMSHICGATNRGDARATAEARRRATETARRMSASIVQRDRQLSDRNAEIQRLSKRVRELEPFVEECVELRRLLDQDRTAVRLATSEKDATALRMENSTLRQSCAGLELQCEHLRARLTECAEKVERNERHNLAAHSPSVDTCAIGGVDLSSDLCGRCFLYVGGRPNTVCHLRAWVTRRNGVLLYHDGGVEHAGALLGDLVRQADVVLFPVDCVSHGAAGVVKKLCESHGKVMCPLRTASLTAFRRAIDRLDLSWQEKR